MAAFNSTSRGVASFGKRFVTQFLTHPTRFFSVFVPFSRRLLHGSVYDKNIEDHVRPVVVPDEVIQTNSDKYWAPNPSTGVFGPDSQPYGPGPMNHGLYTAPSHGGDESVLEQKAFFRPLEDLEKPQHP